MGRKRPGPFPLFCTSSREISTQRSRAGKHAAETAVRKWMRAPPAGRPQSIATCREARGESGRSEVGAGTARGRPQSTATCREAQGGSGRSEVGAGTARRPPAGRKAWPRAGKHGAKAAVRKWERAPPAADRKAWPRAGKHGAKAAVRKWERAPPAHGPPPARYSAAESAATQPSPTALAT